MKSSGSKTAHLMFNRISKADAGMYMYTCRADNSAGSTEKQFIAKVNCEYYLQVIHTVE